MSGVSGRYEAIIVRRMTLGPAMMFLTSLRSRQRVAPMGSRMISGNFRAQVSDGFSLLELLVVVAILATLISVAAPRYWASVQRSEATVLRHNLIALRGALDDYKADKGHFPPSLDMLVEHRYLTSIPVDPINGRTDSWILVPAAPPSTGIAQVRSGAHGTDSNGTSYRQY